MAQTQRTYRHSDNSNDNTKEKLAWHSNTVSKSNDGPRKTLPIVHYTNEIISSVENFPVTIIQGETGCGKSSVVPQIVLDNCTSTLKKDPFVVVMQPRKIAAIGLAKYVNKQRGGGVGHAVGHDPDSDTSCPLLFVTAGWLLKKIAHTPAFFSRISHIVMDEIHERSIEVDLLFFVVKQLFLQQLAPDCEMRIILMSATLNALSIGNYFSFAGCPVADPILVVDRLFPVDIFYLDTLFECNTVNLRDIPLQPHHIAAKINNAVEKPENAPIANMIELAVYICREIAIKHSRDDCGVCVLVFLPGVVDIEMMIDSLIDILEGTNEKKLVEVMVLHSLLEREEQAKVFGPIEPCTTRLILATNIAESSITLPQLRYVIDLGLNKHLSRSASHALCLQEYWISNASSQQRAGRVGRLFPGTVFRIYSQSFHAQLPQFDLPEILHTSLDSTILLLLTLHKTKRGIFSSPSESLAKLISPPDPESIIQSYVSLCESGCIVCSSPGRYTSTNADGVALTPLGEFLQYLPFDVTIGKMVAIGAVFDKYLPHTIIMATAASLPEVFVRPNFFQGDLNFIKKTGKNQECRIHFDNGAFSDLIAVVKMYRDYTALKKEQQKSWCFRNCIHFARMKVLVTTVNQVALKIMRSCPHFSDLLGPLYRGEDVLQLGEDDTKILRIIIAHSFSHNLLVGRISKVKGPGDDFLQIKYVPINVMTNFFRENLNSLFGPLNPLTIEEADKPMKAKNNKDLPRPYFSITMQFKPSIPTHPVITYPPFGKHHFTKCFNREMLHVHPQLYDIENTSGSSSISDVFTLHNPNTSNRSVWTLVDGTQVELLRNSPFSTLQLSEITQKSVTIYGVTPTHTLTKNGTVLVENMTLFVPSQLDDPFISFLLLLSAKSSSDFKFDKTIEHVTGVRIAEHNIELSPKPTMQIFLLLQAIHDYIKIGLHSFNRRIQSEVHDLHVLTSSLCSLATLPQCEAFEFDAKLPNYKRVTATATSLQEKSWQSKFKIFTLQESGQDSWETIRLPPDSTKPPPKELRNSRTKTSPQKTQEKTHPQKLQEKTLPKKLQEKNHPQKSQEKNRQQKSQEKNHPQKTLEKTHPQKLQEKNHQQKSQEKNRQQNSREQNHPQKSQEKNHPQKLQEKNHSQKLQEKNHTRKFPEKKPPHNTRQVLPLQKFSEDNEFMQLLFPYFNE